MAGTLIDWMTILLLGAIFLGVFGYHNVYIPKDQQEKAERVLRGEELEVSEEDEAPKVITYEIRFSRIWYVVLTTVVSIITIICFVIEDFSEIVALIGHSLVGVIVGIIVVIVISMIIEYALLLVCFNTEYNAIRGIKKHYLAHYGVFVVAKE